MEDATNMLQSKVLGQRLIKLRETKKMTQVELAKDLGITRSSLSLYELGERTINTDVLYDIAKYFNVSADYLIGLSDTQSLDTDLQAVCKYTGLSEESIKKMKGEFDIDYEISMESDSTTLAEVLNCVFCSDVFWDMIWDWVEIQNKSDEYINSYGNKIWTSMSMIAEIFEIPSMQVLRLMNLERNEMENLHQHLDDRQCRDEKCDLLRYKISKTLEKITDYFDKRTERYECDIEATLKYLNITEEQIEKLKKERITCPT